MKKLMSSFIFLLFLSLFMQTKVFAGQIVNANFLNDKISDKKLDVVFIVNKDVLKISPVKNKAGYYMIHLGQTDKVSFISNPKYDLSGSLTMSQFAAIDWKTFHPNMAMAANINQYKDQRETWLFVVENAKQEKEEGFTFLAKVKNGSQEPLKLSQLYHATLFIDGFPIHF